MVSCRVALYCSQASVYCGDVGKGTQLKLVVNMVMAAQLAALAEGQVLA